MSLTDVAMYIYKRKRNENVKRLDFASPNIIKLCKQIYLPGLHMLMM